jgi:adenosine deaminase CECR1
MMQQLLADGVKWIDLRLAFTFFYYAEGQDEPEPSYERMFKVFGEEIEKFKASEEGKEFWGCRMIWTGIRVLDTRKIVEDMDQCIFIKQLYPDLISGYDLVGQEDAGRPLKDLLPELFWFKKQCAQEGIDIPFFFHAGECLGDGSDTDQNLFDAVLLGTRRIGHGFSLYKHPLLIDMVKEKRILVESCPISNEVLRLCASVMSHPLPALLARGVACSLCNDDPAILGQDTAGKISSPSKVKIPFYTWPSNHELHLAQLLTTHPSDVLNSPLKTPRNDPRLLASSPRVGQSRPRRPRFPRRKQRPLGSIRRPKQL